MECKKEIKTEENDVIIIDDDSDVDQKPLINVSPPGKPKKCKRKRRVKMSKSKDSETLVITQEVKVKKQKIQCIVNLSNMCKYKEGKRVAKSLKVDRIVPHCLRKTCCEAIKQKTRKKHTSKTPKSKVKKGKKSTKVKKDRVDLNLSPISSAELHTTNNDVSLEKISSDSFSVYSDYELDTLIKRTKERERKSSNDLQKANDNAEFTPYTILMDDQDDIPLYTSTPKTFDSSEADKTLELPKSEMNNSLHSIATLVLEPQERILYSPTNPTMSPHKEPFDVNGNYKC